LWILVAERGKHAIYVYKNYRAVEEIFEELVLYPILQHLQDKPIPNKNTRVLTIIVEDRVIIKEVDNNRTDL